MARLEICHLYFLCTLVLHYLAPEDLHTLRCQGHQPPPQQDILQRYLHAKRLRHMSVKEFSQHMLRVRRLIGTLTPACISGAKSGMCSCSKPHTCIIPAKGEPCITYLCGIWYTL